MDASTAAVKESESSLSWPFFQGSFPQDAASTSRTKDDKREQEDVKLSACIPDPTVIITPRPKPLNASTGTSKSNSVKAWELDIYVVMRCYRPGSKEHSKYQVVASEEPISMTQLRFAERNVVYETLLAKAPAGEIQHHYRLHLARLKGLRQIIAARAQVTKELQEFHLEHYLYLKGVRGKKSQSEVKRLEEGLLAYNEAVKGMNKLRACERTIERLLVRCEDAGKGEPGFEKVGWQTVDDGDRV